MTVSKISAVASAGGLKWKPDIWGDLHPEWTREPDVSIITKIARRELNIPDDVICEINFLGEGAFNKVYTIQCNGCINHVIRISLPVKPHFKTMSEAATITYIRHYTDIPAPNVSVSDPGNKNELGFEWMIQDFVPSRMLADAWKEMSWLKKELVVRKIVNYSVQLFEKRFTPLRSLYTTKDPQRLATAELPDAELLGAEYSTDMETFCQSRIVSMPFFWGKHLSCDVPRGPFTNSVTGSLLKFSYISSTSTIPLTQIRMNLIPTGRQRRDTFMENSRRQQASRKPPLGPDREALP
jgi:hypothetical protein